MREDLEHIGFYERMRSLAGEKGISLALFGGMACLKLNIVDFTKDVDFVIHEGSPEAVLCILTGLRHRDLPCRYRLEISAPLDSSWLDGGWSAHFTFGAGGAELPSLDFYSHPPRIHTRRMSIRADGVIDLHSLAESKKTNRHKDWGVVNAIGRLMLDEGNPQGFYHLYDADYLLEAGSRRAPEAEIMRNRPALKLLGENKDRLEKALALEIEFWSRLNKLRLDIFMRAAYDYHRRLATIAEHLYGLPLAEQHATIVSIAERHLPKTPITPEIASTLYTTAAVAVSVGVEAWLAECVPGKEEVLEGMRYGT